MERTAAREAGGCSRASRTVEHVTPHYEPRWSAEPHLSPGTPVVAGAAAASEERALANAVDDAADGKAALGTGSAAGRRFADEESGAQRFGARRPENPALDDIAHLRAAERAAERAAVFAGVAENARADRLARSVIDDIAHGHPDAVLNKMQQLNGAGGYLSPKVRDEMLASIRQQSEAVAARFEQTLATGASLNTRDLSVIVDHGRLVLNREVVVLGRVAQGTSNARTWVQDREVLYVDTRVLVSRELMVMNTGVEAASLASQHGVKLVELNSDAIGELPDRLVEKSTGLIAERSAGPLPRTGPGLPPLHIVLLEKCDPRPDTAATRSPTDAC